MAPVIPFIPLIASVLPIVLQASGVMGGGQQQAGARGPGLAKTPGLVSPRDPAAAIRRARPDLQTAGLAQVSPGMEAQMAGLTPEEWELIVQQGGG